MRFTAYLYTPTGNTGRTVASIIKPRPKGPKIQVGNRNVYRLKPSGGYALTDYTAQMRLPVDAEDRQRVLAALDLEADAHWNMRLAEHPITHMADLPGGDRRHDSHFNREE